MGTVKGQGEIVPLDGGKESRCHFVIHVYQFFVESSSGLGDVEGKLTAQRDLRGLERLTLRRLPNGGTAEIQLGVALGKSADFRVKDFENETLGLRDLLTR